MAIKITLDPGHSIKYNQGVNKTYYESDRMYDLALYLKSDLEAYGIFEVFLTKSTLNSNPGLTERGNMAIKNKSRVFLSLHTNAAGATAQYAVTFGSVARQGNMTFAKELSDVVSKVFAANGATGVYAHTITSKESSSGIDYYGVIRNAVTSDGVELIGLIEHGFHTHAQSCALLDTTSFLQQMSTALADYLYTKLLYMYIPDDIATFVGAVKSTVNVRALGNASSQKLGSLSSGQSIQIVTKVDGWYKFIWNGAAAWVHGDYVTCDADVPASVTVAMPTKTDTAVEVAPPVDDSTVVGTGITESAKTGKVINSPLNLRSGPGVQYSIIEELPIDTSVVIKSTSGSWMYVDTYAGVGYVHKDYVEIQEDVYSKATVNVAAGLNVRKGPGTEYPKVCTIANNSIVWAAPSGTSGWVKVKLKEDDEWASYYMFDSYLIIETTAEQVQEQISISTNPLTKELPVYFGVTTTNGLNVRSKPDASSAKIGSLTSGYYVVIYEIERNSSGQDWYKIIYGDSTTNGGVGYCSASYIKIVVDSSMTLDKDVPAATVGGMDMSAMRQVTSDGWWLDTLTGSRVSSKYGYRTHPISGANNSFHAGIDYAANGGLPLYTPVDGLVVANYKDSSYGNLVIILASDASKHYFAHMRDETTRPVQVGQYVAAGERVGYVGTTGDSTGNHLHYEIRVLPYKWQTNSIDPGTYNFPATMNLRY